MPAHYVVTDATGSKARHDYDATELTVRAGEKVEAIREESGWVWCRKEDGREGWLPLECF